MKKSTIYEVIRARLQERRGELPLIDGRQVSRIIIAFSCGLLFAVGLGVAGMTRPSKVIGFLDIFGDWDPSLAFVMIGAIGVDLVLFRLILRRGAPLFASTFDMPARRAIDLRLIAGAIIFGIGWGASGFCPGPAIVSLATGAKPIVIFVCSMLVGMVIWEFVNLFQEAKTRIDEG